MKRITLKNSNKEVQVGKIVCIGRNYAEHAKELGNEVPEKPVVFLKPASALIFSGDNIIHPDFSNSMHHEVELVLLIGKNIKNASLADAENAIEAYAVGLDMTLRDLQEKLKSKGHPWTVAKCFDTSAAVSDFISKDDFHLTLNEEIKLTVNNEVRQKENLNKMLFKPAEIVEYLSSLMTLEAGDLVFTGTPSGVSSVKSNDILKADIDNVLNLECKVI